MSDAKCLAMQWIAAKKNREELNKHISNETVSTLIQDYIKELVSHEVDCMTSSGWFDDQLYKAVKDREDENETN